ncbi:MAG: insulinase family protein [Candidatus Delongbacteria bacterium]
MSDPRNPQLAVGQELHGYTVLCHAEAPNIRAHTWELRHARTGARHVHISHELEENTFITCLRTLPVDSTGVAHILEHGVLEGSRRYPVKMFNQLTGRSLNSFLNAFTSPDRTAYPFATPNAEDWDNLLTRYLDAVFHPLLEEEAFLQEGWRLEFSRPEDPDSPLEIRGVVYNEMKAALSSPDAQFSRRFRRELLPGLCYRHESGGDPQAIPELSYAEWKAFHRRHYQPGNSWTVTFGSLPLAPTLQRLDECFAGLEGGPALELGPQPPLGAPRQLRAGYPTLAGGKAPRYAAVGWRLSPQLDLAESLRLSFLFDVLCGGLAAPLNHALLQSGLGPALAPVGFDSSFSQLTFGIGLKDVAPGAGPELEAKVLEILGGLAAEGLEPSALTAALDRFELETREQSRAWGMPWGLGLSYFGLPHWMAGGSLSATLRNDLLLEDLRREAAAPDFLPGLIRRWLLDNPERLLVELEPEPGAVEAREMRLNRSLEARRAALGEEERQALLAQAERVAAWRADEGDLSCMPELDPARQPRTGLTCRHEEIALPGGRLLLQDQPVNGLAHLRLSLPLSATDPDLPLVDLLGWLARLSHAGLGVEASERRLRSLTGGIALGSHHSLPAQGDRALHRLSVAFHGLSRRTTEWLGLLEDLLLRPDLQDVRRLQELLRMRQSSLRSQVISGASHIALQVAQDRISPIGRIQSEVEGLGFLRRLHGLDAERDELGARLRGLLERALAGEGRLLSLCAEAENFPPALDGLRSFLGSLPARPAGPDSEPGPVGGPRATLQACTTEVDGAFVAESWPAPALGEADAARLTLIGTWMQLPLYERIRARGGAYGAQASYDWSQRCFSFLSWRDPRIAGTYADFDEVRGLVLAGRIGAEDLRRAKIEALRRLDTPLLPHERANRCFQHRLHGSGPELRDAFRAQLLDATPAELAAAAGRWLSREDGRTRAVVCSPALLEPARLDGLAVEQEEILPA